MHLSWSKGHREGNGDRVMMAKVMWWFGFWVLRIRPKKICPCCLYLLCKSKGWFIDSLLHSFIASLIHCFAHSLFSRSIAFLLSAECWMLEQVLKALETSEAPPGKDGVDVSVLGVFAWGSQSLGVILKNV